MNDERGERQTRIIPAYHPPSGLKDTEGVLLIRVLTGELKGQEAMILADQPFTIGAGLDVTLRLPDPSVSRHHIELMNDCGIVHARDLDSTNGCYYEGTRFSRLELAPGAVFRIGETELQIVAPQQADPLPPSDRTSFGRLLGKSRKMRAVFAVLERATRSEATVLITGETGTGKEVVAEEIHNTSNRRSCPFVVVDCASIPANLIDSELFGHVRGAFTNAMSDRIGAFEAANGGTIFLDELGELPASQQAYLLRVLETRQIKPVGTNELKTVDVRVVAATNRSLEEEVKNRKFRSDLYFRLAVVRVSLPPLRERREDIPDLARAFLARYDGGSDPGLQLTPDVLRALTSYDWPGNVRELRNVIDQAASLSSEGLSLALRLKAQPAADPSPATLQGTGITGGRPLFDLPYKEARREALAAFELAYAQHAVESAGGNITRAAEHAQVHRNVLHRILARTKKGETPPA